MSRFEPFDRSARRPAAPASADVRIRAAVPDDVVHLADIEAAREGRPAVDFVPTIDAAVRSAASTGRALVLVAEHGGRLVALAKAGHFTPAPDAPSAAPPGWYLTGVIVVPEYRRRGIGRRLTRARLDWIARRAPKAFYFTNARNRVSIELHRAFGFKEVTRDFTFPGVTFEGGDGVLFVATLRPRRRPR